MDLGLTGRRVAVLGEGALAEACAARFAEEGARTGATPDACDVLVFIASGHAGELASADEASVFQAWDGVERMAEAFGQAVPVMAGRGFGRLIFCGPVAAKRLGTPGDSDIDRITGLGALGLCKAISGERGPDGITTNSVLWDGDDLAGAAATVVFLASGGAGYLNGVVIAVDGGRSGGIF